MSRDAYRLAVSYPYIIPGRSYVVIENDWRLLDADTPFPDVSGRRPILAAGSNQSPEQLIRKFKGRGLGPVYAERARLRDFDVVHSAHVARYGSIPATPFPSPGTEVTVFINWLTPDQEARMHETELSRGNYRFGRLDGVHLALESGPVLESIAVYSSTRGALESDGGPIPLAAAKAENRRWPAMTQMEVQQFARDLVDPGREIEAFVLAAVDDPAVRRARTEALMAASVAFACPAFSPIAL